MTRPLASLASLFAVAVCVGVVVTASACPDPCVFGGGACNDNDDCSGREVCRITRDFEGFGCALVDGRCIDVEDLEDDGFVPCGSVDDCGDGACCDPETDTCVGELAYTSLRCDDFTCGDCDDTAFGDRCELNGDCDDDEACTADGVNGFGTIVEKGVCRPLCAADDACGPFERCVSGACTAPVGTPCAVAAPGEDGGEDGDGDVSFSDDECLGLDCTRLDAQGERGDDAYCTASCFAPGTCPLGFVCDDSVNACRRL